MSRRLEFELTSERPDGVWTWRAAGAKQPKGELAGSLLPTGAKVGDVLRADAEFAIDGIEILSVLPPKAPRKEPETLTVIGTRQDEPLVTTQLVEKRGRGRDGDRRGPRRDRGDRDDRGPRSGAARGSGAGRPPRREGGDERPRRPAGDRPAGRTGGGQRDGRSGGGSGPRRERSNGGGRRPAPRRDGERGDRPARKREDEE